MARVVTTSGYGSQGRGQGVVVGDATAKDVEAGGPEAGVTDIDAETRTQRRSKQNTSGESHSTRPRRNAKEAREASARDKIAKWG